MMQPVGLPDDVRVQRDGRDERSGLGLAQHLIDLGEAEIAELGCACPAHRDRIGVVSFLRIGNGQDRSGASRDREWPIVGPPVEKVAVARFGQKVGCRRRFRDPVGGSGLAQEMRS